MRISRLKIEGYRSIRSIDIDLGAVNVFVGANGTGKSNLYRALNLVAAAAGGQLAPVLAREGGMSSALWNGRRNKHEIKGFALTVKLDDMTYSLTCGRIPISERTFGGYQWFGNDPDIKEETVKVDYRGRDIAILERKRGHISARNMDGRPIEYPLAVSECESVLSGLREPHLFPDLSILRQEILSWRFYHHFRTDLASPLRREQVPAFTPILSHDGRDVASALASIIAVDGPGHLRRHIDEAFPGSNLDIEMSDSHVAILLHMSGMGRPFSSRELSDGTLQYLCLLAALLTPRPPTLMVLNEPETSVHPDLYEPMAKLIVEAGKRSQLIITTHASGLARHIEKLTGTKSFELIKVKGATRILGALSADDDADDDLDDDLDDQESNPDYDDLTD